MKNIEPLRRCRVCGLEAWDEKDLDLFIKAKRYLYGRSPICKKCQTTKDHPRPPYLRKCNYCGLEAYTQEDLKLFIPNSRYRNSYINQCKKCTNKRNQERRREKPFHYLWLTKKSECKNKDIRMDLEDGYLKMLWGAQNGLCALSKLPMFLPYSGGDWDLIGSLDRIDPDKGYTKGNVRWILNCVNTFKARQSDEFVIKVARAIADTHPITP